MKRKNSKGFTLVELLAVIVILAILMVSAGAGVMATMNNSKVNTFKNEALTAVNAASNMYSTVSMDAELSAKYIVSSTNGNYAGMCVTLSGLVSNGFLDKDIKTYGGVILIEVPYSGGETKYEVWMHNSQYGINGIEKSRINKLKMNGGNNSGATVKDGGGEGIVTTLTGLQTVVKNAMGGTSLNGTVNLNYVYNYTGTTNGFTAGAAVKTPTSAKSFTSPDATRGGTGATYNNI